MNKIYCFITIIWEQVNKCSTCVDYRSADSCTDQEEDDDVSFHPKWDVCCGRRRMTSEEEERAELPTGSSMD